MGLDQLEYHQGQLEYHRDQLEYHRDQLEYHRDQLEYRHFPNYYSGSHSDKGQVNYSSLLISMAS